MGRENVAGRINLLRVHDRGTKYGPAGDRINVETVVQFVGRPDEAFGFKLRDDGKGPARQGMLALLRDGFNHDWIVNIDYDRDTAAGKRNGTAMRVWLTKPPGPAGGVIFAAGDAASPRKAPPKRAR